MTRDAPDAVVVGSGPNGLAAAITLAQAGRRRRLRRRRDVGGGMRSAELTLPGFIHDVCSTIQGTSLASPFFRPSTCRASASSCSTRERRSPTRSTTAAWPCSSGRGHDRHRPWVDAAVSPPHGAARARRRQADALRARSVPSFPSHPLARRPSASRLALRRAWPAAFRTSSHRRSGRLERARLVPLGQPPTAALGLVLGALRARLWLAGGARRHPGHDRRDGRTACARWAARCHRPARASLDELPAARAVLFDTDAAPAGRDRGRRLPAAFGAASGASATGRHRSRSTGRSTARSRGARRGRRPGPSTSAAPSTRSPPAERGPQAGTRSGRSSCSPASPVRPDRAPRPASTTPGPTATCPTARRST